MDSGHTDPHEGEHRPRSPLGLRSRCPPRPRRTGSDHGQDAQRRERCVPATPVRADVDPAFRTPRFLALPDDVVAYARPLATTLVGSATGYRAAAALERYFHDEGGFTYDLDPDLGDGTELDQLERFMTVKRGFCQQFTAAFTVLARSIGLPTRIAVGFKGATPGDDGWWHVKGADAHSWPEVAIDGVGWVAFEPTVGEPDPTPEVTPVVPPTTAPPTTLGAPATTAPTPSTSSAATTTTVVTPQPSTDGETSPWGPTLGVLGALLALIAGVAAVLHRRRRNRPAPPPTSGDGGWDDSPDSRVGAAWQRTERRFAEADGPVGSALSPDDAARERGRVALLDAPTATAYGELAAMESWRRFGPTALASDHARRAESIEAAVAARLDRSRSADPPSDRPTDPPTG
ncbi:MAG: transglutaminase-like domain-containing protein [Microthrixaceae bacterium]